MRDGEQLDVARLRDYLAAHLPAAAGPLEVEQFPHGHSNLTYLIRTGDQEWVLRRPPLAIGSRRPTTWDASIASSRGSASVYEPAPAPVLYCDDESILGAPFYLMERRKGVILRGTPPPDRPIPPELVRRLCETLVDNMALLHALDYHAAGLDDLGKPQGYVERQVTGWTKRYQDARTDDVPDLERTMTWLAANRPAESAGATLIHNDFKFDNLVLDPDDLTRIVAVLDWEMATLGDPLMDLGTTLAYWTEANDPAPLHQFIVGPTTQPGSLSRRELVERYGADDRPRHLEHALLLRLRPVQGRGDRPADLRPLCPRADPGPSIRQVQPGGGRARPGRGPGDRYATNLMSSTEE